MKLIRRVRSENVPWLTSEIKAKMYHRDFPKKKTVETGSIHFHNAYKNARNNLSKLVKDTKTNYYNIAINQCNEDPKSMWKTINQLKNKKSKTTKINELIIDQKVATNPDEIAGGLNKYFNDIYIYIGTVLADNLPIGENSFETYVNPIETLFEFKRFL